MKSSAEKLLSNIEIYYENIYILMKAFQEANDLSADETITVTLKDLDGNTIPIEVNSFQKLSQELLRLDNNFKSLTNADNISYILNSDGSISSYAKTSHMNAEFIDVESLEYNSNCIIDRTSAIDDLVFPTVKLPIRLDDNITRSTIYCKYVEITSGWDSIKESPKMFDLEYMKTEGMITFNTLNRHLEMQKEYVKNFGKFTTENSEIGASQNEFKLKLNTIKYTSVNVIGDSIDLKIGDMLVSKTGSSKYQITSIDKFLRIVNVQRIAGTEPIKVGLNNLYFNEQLPTDKNVVNIPIKPGKKYIIFLSTENHKNISYPSNGLKIDTSNYKVIDNGMEYTIDEYFAKNVVNFSEYLTSMMNETTIPHSLGITPKAPVLMGENFHVIQINKHVTDAKTTDNLAKLNKQKQQITNDIDVKEKEIEKKQKELDTKKFSSAIEKQYLQDTITKLRTEINTLKTQQTTVIRDIDTYAIKNGVKNSKPKFRVIGFWPHQLPIFSDLTAEQHIIKYDIQYRYLSKDIEIVDNPSYSMIDDNGKKISVTFSPWNIHPSQTLSKTEDINGKLKWENIPLDSVDDININQLAISINANESIEIRVRAISEAGYPLAPLKSEWSDILRVDFPESLTDNNLNSQVEQNNRDLQTAEFNELLIKTGLYNHISREIQEAEKKFYHPASDIASGQYTAEQKHIPLDVAIQTLFGRVRVLENADAVKNVEISILDFNEEEFLVKNNSTVKLSAGNYTDNLNILDKTKFGTIVSKYGYIRIKNTNEIPIELKTLVPGVSIDAINAGDYYNTPIVNKDQTVQNSKQIIYFRNKDLTGQSGSAFSLVTDKLPATKTYPDASELDPSAIDSDKNLVYITQGGTVSIGKLKPVYQNDFVAVTKEHPLYDENTPSRIETEIKRISNFTDNIKLNQKQTEGNPQDNQSLGFKDNDLYAVGKTTCGAFLYPIINNFESISVVGNTTTATLSIAPNSEILIPIVFEYRMIDRFGNVDGNPLFNTNNPLEYFKKLGIDLIVNNTMIKFDIEVRAKLKSKITVADTVGVETLRNTFNNEKPETLH